MNSPNNFSRILIAMCVFALASVTIVLYPSRAYVTGDHSAKTSHSSNGAILLDAGSNVRLEALPEPKPAAIAMAPFGPPKGNLDQTRNGSAVAPINPPNWVNGNAGASQAHFNEGHSIPYRAVLTDLALGAHTIEIEWDIRHSSKNAIDYITHYQRLNPHLFIPPHAAETVDPTVGVAGLGAPTTFPIPSPNQISPTIATASFNVMPSGERDMTIYNGAITALSYVSEGSLAAASSSTRMLVTFNATSPTVVIAWGGHIATSVDWGAANSAGSVSGSPYHTRLLTLDGASTGSQDRSLSAGAIVLPPTCSVTGASSVCPGSTNTYSAPVLTGVTYLWSLSANTANAMIIGSATGQTVNVKANSCGSYTLNLTITRTSDGGVSNCSKTVGVVDTTAPTVVSCPTNATIQCPATPVFGTPTFSDSCDTNLTVTIGNSNVPAGCGNTGTYTRTWTATDDCGNTAMCSQTITVVDTMAPMITCPSNTTVACLANVPAAATTLAAFQLQGGSASDTCSSVTITSTQTTTDVSPCGLSCGGRILRTYRATDACGNFTECTQTITYGTPASAAAQSAKRTLAKLLSAGDLVVGEPGVRSLTIPGGANADASAVCLLSKLPTGGLSTALPEFGDRTLDPISCQTSPSLQLQDDGTWESVLLGQAVSLALNLRLDEHQLYWSKDLLQINRPGADANFELGRFALIPTIWTQSALAGPDGLWGTADDELDPSSARMQFTIPASVLNTLGSDATARDLLKLANAALAGQLVSDLTVPDLTAALDAINRSFDLGKRRLLVNPSKR